MRFLWAGVLARRRSQDPALEPRLDALDTLDIAVYHWTECEQIPANGSLTRWLQMTLS